MDNLMQEFKDKAAKVRIRQNSVASKLSEFLSSEIALGKEITSVNASDLNTDKIHLQTLYTALRRNGIEVKRGVSFVVDLVDSKNVSRAVIKLHG